MVYKVDLNIISALINGEQIGERKDSSELK